MERETLLATVTATLEFTDDAKRVLAEEVEGFWGDDPDVLLLEFGYTWREILAAALSAETDHFFTELGLSGDAVPKVRIGESYKGSFVVVATIVITETIPTAYKILKGVSDLPKIVDGLADLRKRVASRYERESNKVAQQTLNQAIRNARRRQNPSAVAGPIAIPPSLPTRPFRATVVLDARPLAALRPEEPSVLRCNIAVAATHEAISVENLSDATMQNVRVGLFVNDTKQQQWNYADAFEAAIPMLSGKQSISKSFTDFRRSGVPMQRVLDTKPMFVDCWVQDDGAIHLFQFTLPPV